MKNSPYRSMKNTAKSVAKSLNIGIIKHHTLEQLRLLEHAQKDILFLQTLYPKGTAANELDNLHRCILNITSSRSQYRQDIFALSRLNFKTGGYFVEFGATNGIVLSNSYLLEKEFGWSGILAEPARAWHVDLRKNRTAHIETNCVWRESGVALTFNEVEHAGLSTISDFSEIDLHQKSRAAGSTYPVTSISLLDLLDKYKAPPVIDFLSIDTEGSEYEILSHFDFTKYQFRVITCEHNYTPARERILELLNQHGYSRVFSEISFNDDWYILDHSV